MNKTHINKTLPQVVAGEGDEWMGLSVGRSSPQWKENQPSICWGGGGLHLPGSAACLCFWPQRDTRNWAMLNSGQGESVMPIKAPLSTWAKDHRIYSFLKVSFNNKAVQRIGVIQHCFDKKLLWILHVIASSSTDGEVLVDHWNTFEGVS